MFSPKCWCQKLLTAMSCMVFLELVLWYYILMQFSSLLLWASDVPVPVFCIPAPIRSFGTSKFLSAGKSTATIHIGLKEVGYVNDCYAVIFQMKIYISG